LHVGNARIAIINYLFCKRNDGQFLLRIDDTDRERSTVEYEKSIMEDLEWLEIGHDIFTRQSERVERYTDIKNMLIQRGMLYRCYESQEELAFKRRQDMSAGRPPIYDRASLSLSDKEREELERSGIEPHWRFKLPNKIVSWNDMIMGKTSYDLRNVSDPVVLKSDGTYLYSFCSVIDDIDYAISHIIRGQDHVTNTAIQLAIFEAISGIRDYDIEFAHISLLVNKDGSQFSKRIGSLGLRELRAKHIDPMAICNVLATLGSSVSSVSFPDLDSLVQSFDLQAFGNNSPKFDTDDIVQMNKKLIQKYTYQEVTKKLGSKKLTEQVFEVCKWNVENINDFNMWIDICSSSFVPSVVESLSLEDKEFLKTVRVEMENTKVEYLIQSLKQKTSRANKDIYTPIRKAICGLDHGPSLADLIRLIGKEICIKRIQKAIEN
jgi:glutamyl-tRNA synthetase